MKINLLMTLVIATLIGFSHYCSAYTWNVINLTGIPLNIKIKLDRCKGENPWKNVQPSSLANPKGILITPSKPYQQGCCIAGVQIGIPEKGTNTIRWKDIEFKAISHDQLTRVMALPGGITGATTIAGPIELAALAEIPVAAAALPVAMLGTLLFAAGAGAAFGITEAIDRCKSRDLIVASDGAYLVVEKKQEAE